MEIELTQQQKKWREWYATHKKERLIYHRIYYWRTRDLRLEKNNAYKKMWEHKNRHRLIEKKRKEELLHPEKRELRLEYHKNYYQMHKETLSTQAKVYYRAHSNEIKIRVKKYIVDNKPKVQLLAKLYYASNNQKLDKYRHIWYVKNKDKILIKIKNYSKSPIIKEKKRLSYYSDENKCKVCGVLITNHSLKCQKCNIRIGELNHSWKGGVSFEPYSLEWKNSLREFIRRRDDYLCQECGISQLDSNRRLCVHHIDYNKYNCSEQNLLSLCILCHSLTNIHRSSWVIYFHKYMVEKYNYIYNIGGCDYDFKARVLHKL